jgi:hypothetical protein
VALLPRQLRVKRKKQVIHRKGYDHGVVDTDIGVRDIHRNTHFPEDLAHAPAAQRATAHVLAISRNTIGMPMTSDMTMNGAGTLSRRSDTPIASKKQDIYGFLVKNLDLDSNLYNLKKRIKKAS